MPEDVFADCTEPVARSRMRDGLFEWEGRGTLADGHPVALALCWQPGFDGPFEGVLAAARAAWERVRTSEAGHRRALVADVTREHPWVRVTAGDIPPKTVWFGPDGSAEIGYGAFVDGEHGIHVELSPDGEWVGWRAE